MRRKKNKDNIIKTNLEILPIRHYDNSLNCFILDNGSCLDILRIISRDVSNLSDDELQREIYSLIRSYKTIGADLKCISMNFPLNTSKQREILKQHREKAEDAVRIKWIDRQIEELEIVDQNIHTSNFYLFCFGDNIETFKKNKESIDKYLCSGIDALCEQVEMLQKLQILVKLNNMNGLYDIHYFESEDING